MPPYAYVTAFDDNALTIIDVANPAAPAFVGSIQGAGAPPWLGGASDVFVVGNYAYVAAYLDNALTIIDVANPAAPAFVGSIQGFGAPNFLGQANGVFVVGHYAYVAAYKVHALGDGALTIIDVANPVAPVFAGSIQGNGAPNFLKAASSVYVQNGRAYVVSDGNGAPFTGDNALTIIDVTNPLAPTLLGSIQGMDAPDWLGGARGVFKLGNYAYVAAYYNNGGLVPAFTIIDVSNPAIPLFSGSIQGGWGAPPWLAGVYGIHVTGGIAYVAAGDDSALTLIDVTNPVAPAFLSSIQDPGGPFLPSTLATATDVFVVGSYAYVVCPAGGPAADGVFTIVDISNPAALAILGSISGAGALNWLGGARGVHIPTLAPAAGGTGNPGVMELLT